MIGQFDSIKVSASMESTIYFPNSFTPNGDEVNDSFFVYGNNINHVKKNIYNRC